MLKLLDRIVWVGSGMVTWALLVFLLGLLARVSWVLLVLGWNLGGICHAGGMNN